MLGSFRCPSDDIDSRVRHAYFCASMVVPKHRRREGEKDEETVDRAFSAADDGVGV